MRYRFVEHYEKMFRVRQMCQVLGISPSSYYYWKSQAERRQQHSRADEELLGDIRRVYEESRKTYGSPRIARQFRREGKHVNRKRIACIMRSAGIRGKAATRKRLQARSAEPFIADLVKRNFQVLGVNRLWTSDITYVWTGEGWLYLATVLDVFSRKIVGYEMSACLTEALVREALQAAVMRRGTEATDGKLVFHSDGGGQYRSHSFKSLLSTHRISQSMGRSCFDNAVSESLFHTLKVELIVKGHPFRTRQEAREKIFEYIEVFYNRKRLHSSLGYRTPEEYEQLPLTNCPK